MTMLADIIKDFHPDQSLALFPAAEIAAIESALFEKGGKVYVKCLATGKDRQAKPEEVVRQLEARQPVARRRQARRRNCHRGF